MSTIVIEEMRKRVRREENEVLQRVIRYVKERCILFVFEKLSERIRMNDVSDDLDRELQSLEDYYEICFQLETQNIINKLADMVYQHLSNEDEERERKKRYIEFLRLAGQ